MKNAISFMLSLLLVTQYYNGLDIKLEVMEQDTKAMFLRSEIKSLRYEIALIHKRYQEQIRHNQKQAERNHFSVEATAYTFSKDECDDTPWRSAYGRSSYGGVAISRDMMKSGQFQPGDLVLIISEGQVMTRYVLDTMDERFTKRIDIPVKSKWWARNYWGVRNVEIINLTGVKRDIKDEIPLGETLKPKEKV